MRIEFTTMLRICQVDLCATGDQQLIRVKNLSAGGVMAIVGRPPAPGDRVEVENVVAEDTGVGSSGFATISRDSSLTRTSTLANSSPAASRAMASVPARRGWRSRARGWSRSARVYYTVEVHDVSLGGIKVEPIGEYCVGQPVIVGDREHETDPRGGPLVSPNARPASCSTSRSSSKSLPEWVCKRLELASLKASYKERLSRPYLGLQIN